MTDPEDSQDPNLSHDQTIALQVVLGVVLFSQILLLVGILYNTCFYLIPLRVKNTLICLFYVVSFIVTACYGTSSVCFILDPSRMFYSYD